MTRYVFCGGHLVRTEQAEPECGEDFCDRCGDCLACYGGDPCFDGGEHHAEHYWVKYEPECAQAEGGQHGE